MDGVYGLKSLNRTRQMLDLFECFYLYYPWVLGGQQQYDSGMTIAPEFPGSN